MMQQAVSCWQAKRRQAKADMGAPAGIECSRCLRSHFLVWQQRVVHADERRAAVASFVARRQQGHLAEAWLSWCNIMHMGYAVCICRLWDEYV